jgi:succinate dehydrogenase/fumarate reductase flavoprotein subunit
LPEFTLFGGMMVNRLDIPPESSNAALREIFLRRGPEAIDYLEAKTELRFKPIYQRALGDAGHKPNPCVAPIERAPFYALRVFPADLGTAIGLKIDSEARVLGADGSAIAGLCACGNDMTSIMNGNYPGPGITLGPALTFGYIAGRSLAVGVFC